MPRWIGSLGLAFLLACTRSSTPDTDGGPVADADARTDAGPACACEPGLHAERIFLLSDDAEIWTFDPVTLDTAFVVGPICGGGTPYSMAVDGRGTGYVLFAESLSIQTIDLLDRACAECRVPILSPSLEAEPDGRHGFPVVRPDTGARVVSEQAGIPLDVVGGVIAGVPESRGPGL